MYRDDGGELRREAYITQDKRFSKDEPKLESRMQVIRKSPPFEAFSCQRSFQEIKTRALDAQWTGSFITKDHLFVRPLKETHLWTQIAQIPTQHPNKCSNVRRKIPVSSSRNRRASFAHLKILSAGGFRCTGTCVVTTDE